MKYCNKFFHTKDEAMAFKKSHGGALYSYVKGSRTKRSYCDEALMSGNLNENFLTTHPYVVAWNELSNNESEETI